MPKKGYKQTKKHKEKISENIKKNLPKTIYTKDNLSPNSFKKGHTPWNKGKKCPEIGKSLKNILKGKNWEERFGKEGAKERMRIHKNHFKNNPNYGMKGKHHSEETMKKILKKLSKRPTSLEQEMIEIIKKNNLPYKYTGDGSFLIGFKNPDFVNVNGEKICIEVGNPFHHQEDYAHKRIKHFAKYGWKCLVFIGDNLNEGEILRSVK